MRAIILLLGLLCFLAPPAAAQLRGQTGPFSRYAAPLEDTRGAGDSSALHQRAAVSPSFPSAGKVLKRTGIGTLVGVAAGAAFAGAFELTDDHTNHEDDPIVFGVSMFLGAVSGAVVGLVSAFVL
jgi:hypothetical protein